MTHLKNNNTLNIIYIDLLRYQTSNIRSKSHNYYIIIE